MEEQLLKQQIQLLQEIRNLLQRQLDFWEKISSEEYFNEVIEKDGINIPK